MWNEIREIGRQNNLPWVIGGDFNVVRYMEESRRDDNVPYRDAFNIIIDEMALLEIPLVNI